MCGIVGIVELLENQPLEQTTLRQRLVQMLALIRHRGPDQFGIYLDQQAGLGSARLSIIDLSHGQQPISNENDSLWIVFNGEIFNYIELRSEMERRGHTFTTTTDTEVILHLYEDSGPDCLRRLNGQFALAIWDATRRELFLARDRLGVRPLFYTRCGSTLIFASEIKAILAHPQVQAEIDPQAMDQIFTCWSVLSPYSAFRDIWQVPPGHYLVARNGEARLERYWQLSFPACPPAAMDSQRSIQAYRDELCDLLIDATRLRLRADVPVGAYLSGGLDSSLIAAFIRRCTDAHLDTFSITFSEPEFDESEHQLRMAAALGTDHHIVHATHADIGQVFPQVIWHTETPLLRTSPAPLFLLSRLVQENGYKVVLTGEGSDEFLAGYDIFKEALIRRFWARRPDSVFRPSLLRRIYPDIPELSGNSQSYLAAFFGQGLQEVEDPNYSHAIRWRNTGRTRRFFSEDLRQAVAGQASYQGQDFYPPDSYTPDSCPAEFHHWHPLHQAQYLEITIFLSQYLLSSQGDRVAMAHSVEGRFPFLDPRVVAFCNRLPPDLKLRGLTEKFLLRKVAQDWLPGEIWTRRKKPYRAPIQRSFFNSADLPYVEALLSPKSIQRAGLFKPAAVQRLVEKAASDAPLSETDEMALVGILSSQLLHQLFVADFQLPAPVTEADDLIICVQGEPAPILNLVTALGG